MKKKIIALFVDAATVGGIEKHLSILAAALHHTNRWQVHILLWKNYGDGPLNRLLENSPAELHTLHGSWRALRYCLKSNQIETIHTHGYKAGIVGRLCALTEGIPCFSTHHNGDAGIGIVAFYTWLDRMTARLAINFSVSAQIQQRLPCSSQILKNFIEMPCRNALEKSHYSIVFVGRLHPVKRPDRFVQLAAQFPDRNFCVFGDGELRAELESVAPTNVTFAGFAEQPEQIWQNADLCVICSDAEGLPLSALEAMAHGVPVASLSLGELPALIDDGVNGYLADDMTELGGKLQAWLRIEEHEKQQVRQRAMETIVNQYSIDAVLPTLENAYNGAITIR